MKYTTLELFFADHFQFVRKMSKQIWYKRIDSHMWVKLDPHFYKMFKNSKEYIVEDWRK